MTDDLLARARAALDVEQHHSYQDHLDSLTEVVPELVAEVERLRRGGRELGRIVDRLTDDHLAAIGEKPGGDFIDADGDGHWDIVHERLMALRPERDEARAQAERVRELHRPVEIEPSDTICAECSNRMPNGRYMPTVEWPCPTIRALDGEA